MRLDQESDQEALLEVYFYSRKPKRAAAHPRNITVVTVTVILLMLSLRVKTVMMTTIYPYRTKVKIIITKAQLSKCGPRRVHISYILSEN